MLRKKLKRHKVREGKIALILENAGVDLVLDVGANIGQTYDNLRQWGYGGRIVSFEPLPDAHRELERKAARDPLWEIAPRAAVGAEPGEAMLNVSEASDMSSLLPATETVLQAIPRTNVIDRLATPVITLDQVWDRYSADAAKIFLKVDTQGFERQVLTGAAKTLQRICGIQMELSLFPLYEGEELYLSFLQDFHALGFAPYMIVETNYSRHLRRQFQIDAIFMRE